MNKIMSEAQPMPSREEFERLIQNGRRERAMALLAAWTSLFKSAEPKNADVALPTRAQSAAA